MKTFDGEQNHLGRDHGFGGQITTAIPPRPSLPVALMQYLSTALEHRPGGPWGFTHSEADSRGVDALVRRLSLAGVVHLRCEKPDPNSANVWTILRGPAFSLDNLRKILLEE